MMQTECFLTLFLMHFFRRGWNMKKDHAWHTLLLLRFSVGSSSFLLLTAARISTVKLKLVRNGNKRQFIGSCNAGLDAF